MHRGVMMHVFRPEHVGTGLTVRCTFHFGTYRENFLFLFFYLFISQKKIIQITCIDTGPRS